MTAAMGIPSGGLRAGLTDSTPTREGRPFKAATRASAGLGVGVCDCRESRKPSPLSRHEGGESHCPGSSSLTSPS